MVAQSDPKATQMDMGGPFKTYGIYCVEATWGYFGRSRTAIFVLLAFRAPTFSCCLWLLSSFGPNMCPKWTRIFQHFGVQNRFFWPGSPKVATVGSRRVLSCKNDSNMVPQGGTRRSKMMFFCTKDPCAARLATHGSFVHIWWPIIQDFCQEFIVLRRRSAWTGRVASQPVATTMVSSPNWNKYLHMRNSLLGTVYLWVSAYPAHTIVISCRCRHPISIQTPYRTPMQ